MFDCFNMAYQDNNNPLQLHIKINSENLLPVPKTYNSGSLRIPADPSWPKIPQRKLIADVGDTIVPPCIVTLSGTPRRSRTVVETPLNQSPKSVATKDSAYSSFHHQRTTLSMHTLKRLPGYTDPRFKKVSNVKRSQLTSTASLQSTMNQSDSANYAENMCRVEMEEPIFDNSAKKIVQEDGKSYEQHTMKSTENYKENKMCRLIQTSILHNSTNKIEQGKITNSTIETNKNQTAERNECMKNLSKDTLKSKVNDANTQVDITPLAVQENNGQLFFVLDKKIQSHPLNTIHVDTITVPKECVKQCYNVQLPVLTYQNIPMQIASPATNNVLQQSLNHTECLNQSNALPLVKKESEVHAHLDKTQNVITSFTNDDKKVEEQKINEGTNSLKIQSYVPAESKKDSPKPDFTEKIIPPEKLQSSNIKKAVQESSDSEYYVPNITKKNAYNSIVQRLKIKKIPFHTSSEETTDSELIMRKNIQEKICVDSLHGDQTNPLSKEAVNRQLLYQSKEMPNDQDLHKDHKTIISENKVRNKSEQNLVCTKTECMRKLCRNSEPHITFKQKKISAKFSRKARSYFQKNSHSALIDSDYTLVWPNCQYTKHKRNQTYGHKVANGKSKRINSPFIPTFMNERNINTQADNTSKFIEQNYIQNNNHLDSTEEVAKSLSKTCLQREHCGCEVSPRSNTDDIFGRPKAIPPKTQELLNKSYWEYYNKLKHKMKNADSIEQSYPYHLTTESIEKGKKDRAREVHDKELRNQMKVNPELQTLQQCTALSTMINQALDPNLQADVMKMKELRINNNMKSLSNHMISIGNGNSRKISTLSNDKFTPNVMNCNGNKTTDKQFLELKSIIFFSGMMYILIILLPMLYDYFYYEEYDDYENLSYMELIVDYVLSSFKEAFGGVFEGVRQAFFYPVRLYKKL